MCASGILTEKTKQKNKEGREEETFDKVRLPKRNKKNICALDLVTVFLGV